MVLGGRQLRCKQLRDQRLAQHQIGLDRVSTHPLALGGARTPLPRAYRRSRGAEYRCVDLAPLAQWPWPLIRSCS